MSFKSTILGGTQIARENVPVAMSTMAAYADDPVAFWENFGEYRPYDFGAKIASLVASGAKRIAIKSTPGVGKTALLANTVIWFLMSHPMCKIPTTAPTMTHLMDMLWSEIDLWFQRSQYYGRVASLQSTSLRVSGFERVWYAVARTSRKERRSKISYGLQGFHAPYLLYVVDEAHAVQDETYKTLEDAFIQNTEQSTVILIGNAYMGSQYYRDCFNKGSGWETFTITYQDSPRIDQEAAEKMIAKLGIDHPKVKTTLLAQFAEQVGTGYGLMITPGMISDASRERIDVEWQDVTEVFIGIDPARFGKNFSAIAVLVKYGDDERLVPEIVLIPKIRVTDLLRVIEGKVGEIREKLASAGRLGDAVEITSVIEERGIGEGLVDLAVEHDLNLIPYNPSQTPQDDRIFASVRAESLAKLRTVILKGSLKIIKTDKIYEETPMTGYGPNNKGKLTIVSKSDFDGDISTDALDALSMAVYYSYDGEIDV